MAQEMLPGREAPIPAAAAQPRRRIESVDILRGWVMVVMALDHTRDFFSSARFDPTDLSRTWPALFATRWITHFCAPVFVFLAGTGAYLSLRKGRSVASLSRLLWTRGLWLVIVEVTIVRFGWELNFDYRFTMLQVIWAIGWCMVVLAGLVWLPSRAVAGIGIAMIVVHNAFDPVKPSALDPFGFLWNILHVPAALSIDRSHAIFVAYPLVPWIGVMAAGYGFGELYGWEPGRRKRFLLRLGIGLVALFAALRYSNVYGDAQKWASQKNGLFTFFSFINVTKYPPSLLYLLATLGPAIAFLAYLEKPPGWLNSKIVVFGRVPFFFYVIHLPFLHLLAGLVFYAKWGPVVFTYSFANPPPPDVGFGLPAVYAFWTFAVVVLYFPSRWFAGLKARRRDAWLSYF